MFAVFFKNWSCTVCVHTVFDDDDKCSKLQEWISMLYFLFSVIQQCLFFFLFCVIEYFSQTIWLVRETDDMIREFYMSLQFSWDRTLSNV